jgi:flavin-dependent dehydrogenase
VGGEISLRQGSSVVIIGGGPAGSLFAHFLLKYARQQHLSLKVTIFDHKDFLKKGPPGCNLCAGIIAESLNEKLKKEGIYLPEKRIINRLDGYCLHLKKKAPPLHLTCAENQINCIATVYRGCGPRFSRFPEVISFDDFLLTWAQDMGADWQATSVTGLTLPQYSHHPILVHYGSASSPRTMEADLVVGAFGVNSSLLNRLKQLNFGYRPPRTLVTCQAEFKLGKRAINKLLGNFIHVYMLHTRPFKYATFIPKGDYLALTLIGRHNLEANDLELFLQTEEIEPELLAWIKTPNCRCFPRITISSARHPYYHRLVIIGDASFSRQYKNGLESALVTAQLAAWTAVFKGISQADWRENYHRLARKIIGRDNLYGRWLFHLNNLVCSVPILTDIHFDLASGRPRKNSIQTHRLRSILWNMFTGNIPYRQIFKNLLDLKLQFFIMKESFKYLWRRLIKITINRQSHNQPPE